jgi:hypothetical protein
MFIYWAQSVILGLFTIVSILGVDSSALATDLKKPFDERGGSEKITPNFAWDIKYMLAGFFTLHYGLFHWGYFSFIVDSGIFGSVNFADTNLWLACCFFFGNHHYSHIISGTKGRREPRMSTNSSLPSTGGSSRCISP